MDDLIPIEELRKQLGISRVTLWKWEKDGKVKFVRLSKKKIYIERAELNRFIAESRK